MNRRELLTKGAMVGAGALMASSTSVLADGGLPSNETMNIYKVWRDEWHMPPVRKRLVRAKSNPLYNLIDNLPIFKVQGDYTQYSEDRHGKFWADNDGHVFQKWSAEDGASPFVYNLFWTDGITSGLDEVASSAKEDYRKWKKQGGSLTNDDLWRMLLRYRTDMLSSISNDPNDWRKQDFFFFYDSTRSEPNPANPGKPFYVYTAVPQAAVKDFLIYAPYAYKYKSFQDVIDLYKNREMNQWVDREPGSGKAWNYTGISSPLQVIANESYTGLVGEWV